MASKSSGETMAQDNDSAGPEAKSLKRLQSYITECANIFRTSGVDGCRQFLLKKQEEWKTTPLNIAVIGYTGLGKSSFVNAIRYVDADHELGAKVGVNETTLTITGYAHPGNHLLKFWDIPGAGTIKYPKDKYMEMIQIDRYDFFLLVFSGSSTEIDTWLFQEINKRRKQFYIVRTKVGQDLNNNRRSHKSTHDDGVQLKKMRQAAEQLGKDVKPAPKVFLVDNFEPKNYDFPELEKSLSRDFPKLKQQAFVLSMCAYSEVMVTEKAEELRSSVLTTVIGSGILAAKPVPGLPVYVDVQFLTKQLQIYVDQLGLDYTSLEKHAELLTASTNEQQTIVDKKKLQKVVDELQKIVIRKFPSELFTIDGMTTYITTSNIDTSKYNGIIRMIISIIIKLFGKSDPGSISFTSAILNLIIKDAEQVALSVVRYKPA